MHPKDIPNASPEDVLRDILDIVTTLRDGHFSTFSTEALPGVAGQIAQVLNQHLKNLQNFRAEHRRLMEEIGVTGCLGGQMEVPGLTGAWKEMMEDVNRMGAHLTGQFRDGGNIVRALLRGELSSRMTAHDIQGEFREFREKFNDLADRFEQRAELTAPLPVG